MINHVKTFTNIEIERIESKNIKIAKNDMDIIQFVRNVKNKGFSFNKLYLGKIKNNVSEYIKKQFGINVFNYNISLSKNSIKHIFNHHGTDKEILRGQIPLTENDFKNIPTIINEFDSISVGHNTKQNKPTIIFMKNIDGCNVVIIYVSDKHHNLDLISMYKLKGNKKINPVTAVNELNSLTFTSKTNSDTDLSTNNTITKV